MSVPAGPVSDRRLVVTMRHAMHTAVALLTLVAVLRAWLQRAAVPAGQTRAWLALGAAGLLLLLYAAGSTRPHPLSDRVGRRDPLSPLPLGPGTRWWLAGLLLVWGLGVLVADGFAWVAFPLFFLALLALPGPAGPLAVLAMVGWAVAGGAGRDHLWGRPTAPPSVGAWLGPLLGALVALLGHAIYGQLRRDALRHRALLDELRRTHEDLAATEHANGVLAERERLAREIHDTIGQGLASIVVLARTCRPDDPQGLALIETTARENLTEARRFIRDLGGGPAGAAGLQTALRGLVADTAHRSQAAGHRLDVTLSVTGSPPPQLDPATATALHRGTQATLANVLQHAQASRCAVGLGWFGDEVVVDVVDDGVGFDPAAPEPSDESAHFGLRGLRARLAAVGGAVSVDSVPGEGTTVALTAPVRHTAVDPAPTSHPPAPSQEQP
ncbi:sensor histidine kinase [Arsenicicoccus dermatophilus]|uniref:sensor histidine kinase n=1 Tax=Arsenicicoccus dermatophilus TaxID=1076331 RepID=UPI0039172BD1